MTESSDDDALYEPSVPVPLGPEHVSLMSGFMVGVEVRILKLHRRVKALEGRIAEYTKLLDQRAAEFGRIEAQLARTAEALERVAAAAEQLNGVASTGDGIG